LSDSETCHAQNYAEGTSHNVKRESVIRFYRALPPESSHKSHILGFAQTYGRLALGPP